MADELLPILKEAAQAPGLLKQVYKDLAKPGVSQVGKALSTVLGMGNTLLWPLALLNAKAKIALEHNLNKYREQLEGTEDEKIVPVPPEVGVPIADKLSYVTNEELSDLYVNLLAKASYKNTAGQAHPSFVNVIGALSPDEAVLLQEFRHRASVGFLTARWYKKDGREWRQVGDLLTGLEVGSKISFKENLVAYFSNFSGLGIIDIRRDIQVVPESAYEGLEKMYRPFFERSPMQERELRFERGRIDVTPFGDLFLKACLSGLKEPNK
jgi:hypothetical protein